MTRRDPPALCVALPVWLAEAVPPGGCGTDAEGRVAWAIELARRNVAARSGGPFGAAVFDRSDGSLIACAVNRVEPARCSIAHAEILALGLAQAALGAWDLGAGGRRVVLASSAEPCAMCLGALPWSGIAALECGATGAEVEAIGFDEGDKPAEWEARLRARGISVRTGVCRAEAAAVLRDYARSGGALYQPRSGA